MLSRLKLQVEHGLLPQVQHLHESMDSRVITAIGWVDTRDMVADAASKGVVDLILVHTCTGGASAIKHEVQLL